MLWERAKPIKGFSNPVLIRWPPAGAAFFSRQKRGRACVRKQRGVGAVGQHSTLPVCRESNYHASKRDVVFFPPVSSSHRLLPLPWKFSPSFFCFLCLLLVTVYLRLRVVRQKWQIVIFSLCAVNHRSRNVVLTFYIYVVLSGICWGIEWRSIRLLKKKLKYFQSPRKVASFWSRFYCNTQVEIL